MQPTTYRYFVQPLSDNTNEMLAAQLAATSPSTIDAEVQEIVVGKRTIEGVYQVPHRILTLLEKTVHFKLVRVFVQENEGAIRPYKLFGQNQRKLARTKKVKAVKSALAKLPF